MGESFPYKKGVLVRFQLEVPYEEVDDKSVFV